MCVYIFSFSVFFVCCLVIWYKPHTNINKNLRTKTHTDKFKTKHKTSIKTYEKQKKSYKHARKTFKTYEKY